MRVKVTIDGILSNSKLGTVQAINEVGQLFSTVYKMDFQEIKEE